jgi:hypothetical protein
MGFKLHSCSGLRERGVLGEGACLGGSAAGGDQNGLNLRSANWSNDAEKPLSNRAVCAYFEVVGQATPGATVTMNTLSTYRRGEDLRKRVTAAAGDGGVGCRAPADGGVDAPAEPAEDGARALPEASETARDCQW